MIRYIWLLIWCELKTDVVFPRTLALKNHYMTGINKVIYITQRCRAEDMNIRIGPLWQANFLTTSKWWHWHKYIHFNANKYINYWVSWMHIIECVRKFHLRPSQPTLMSHISLYNGILPVHIDARSWDMGIYNCSLVQSIQQGRLNIFHLISIL